MGGRVLCVDTFVSRLALLVTPKHTELITEAGVLFGSYALFECSLLPNRVGDEVRGFFQAGAIDTIGTFPGLLLGVCNALIKDTCVVGSGRWFNRGLSSL
jgi:hypothetical protein